MWRELTNEEERGMRQLTRLDTYILSTDNKKMLVTLVCRLLDGGDSRLRTCSQLQQIPCVRYPAFLIQLSSFVYHHVSGDPHWS